MKNLQPHDDDDGVGGGRPAAGAGERILTDPTDPYGSKLDPPTRAMIKQDDTS